MHGESIRVRTGWVGVIVAAAAGLLSVPGASMAQSPFEAGFGVARNSSPPSELSDMGCAADVGWAAEGRGSFRFSRAVAIEGVLGYNFEQAVRCSAPLDPPVSGERSFQTSTEAGYPFWSSDIRLAFEPSSPAGNMWLRAFGGYGRMWGKGTGYWLAGGGLVFGGNVQTVLDLEWNWFDLPFEETTQVFQNSAVVSESSTFGSTSHSEFRIKAGFRLRF